MPVQVAGAEDLPAIRRLLHLARYAYCNAADEDLHAIVARRMTLHCGETGLPSALLMLDPESRPVTLPAAAPTRVQVRGLAMRRPPSQDESLLSMMDFMRVRHKAPAGGQALLLHVFASEPWMGPALTAAGFMPADTVVYFRLEHLRRLNLGALPAGPAALRIAQPVDLAELAALDLASFDTFWHKGSSDLTELLLRGRMVVAEVDGRLVGYTALLTSASAEAHLARFAVSPEFQGQGIGRQLLDDSIRYCQTQGFRTLALNTQRSNLRSQTVYRAAGFRESGLELPVYTALIAG